MDRLAKQAEKKCIGLKGIKALAYTMQTKILQEGYITTKVSIPAQDLTRGELTVSVIPGTVDNISTSGKTSYTSLWNTLPMETGEIITLSALERASENLQRVDGSQARIFIQPTLNGKSDILIDRSQQKYWKISTWANDAGTRNLGRYQGGAAFYLLNPTSLNDTAYVSYAQNIPTAKNTHRGYQNYSFYYSVPLQFWAIDIFHSRSKTEQALHGYYNDWSYKNNYHYSSIQFNRLLTYNAKERLTAGLQFFDNQANAVIEDVALPQQEKHSSGWKALLNYQLNYTNTTINTALSYQQKAHWFGTAPEEKIGDVSRKGRVLSLDIDANVNFIWMKQIMTYAPKLKVQLTPDRLTTLDQFSLGNRWTVRGFDGQQNLTRDKGWFLQNELRWNLPSITHQLYAGIDMGQVTGKSDQPYNKNRLVGSVIGLRGWAGNAGYELFSGIPLYKPDDFKTDKINLGLSLQWQY
ncbi:ShlB/FhaC/HecB family hemolysin secretion/activation protein [[Pantoea] beijingensis]|nr:ShlB/FhaC/HecB family hemolysin secretion/activation protein [[Pantoea] beijingensis]